MGFSYLQDARNASYVGDCLAFGQYLGWDNIGPLDRTSCFVFI